MNIRLMLNQRERVNFQIKKELDFFLISFSLLFFNSIWFFFFLHKIKDNANNINFQGEYFSM